MALFTDVSSQIPTFQPWVSIFDYQTRVENNPTLKFCDYSPTHGGNKNLICGVIAREECKYYPGSFRCINCMYKHRGITLDFLKFKESLKSDQYRENLLSSVSSPPLCETKLSSPRRTPSVSEPSELAENFTSSEDEEAPFEKKELSVDLPEEKARPKNYILEAEAKMARGRGRPRKNPSPPDVGDDKLKRGRGRPRKNSIKNAPKRGRGRPKGSFGKARKTKDNQIKHTKSAWITAKEFLQRRVTSPREMYCSYSPMFGRYYDRFCGNEIESTQEDYFWNYRCVKCIDNYPSRGMDIILSCFYPYFLEGVALRPLDYFFDFDDEPLSEEKGDKLPFNVKFNKNLITLLGEDWYLCEHGEDTFLVEFEVSKKAAIDETGLVPYITIYGKFANKMDETSEISRADLINLGNVKPYFDSSALGDNITLGEYGRVFDVLMTKIISS